MEIPPIKRRALMQLHLTVEEKGLVKQFAQEEAISPSKWIRRAILKELERRGVVLGL
jgi:hypothetical protein